MASRPTLILIGLMVFGGMIFGFINIYGQGTTDYNFVQTGNLNPNDIAIYNQTRTIGNAISATYNSKGQIDTNTNTLCPFCSSAYAIISTTTQSIPIVNDLIGFVAGVFNIDQIWVLVAISIFGLFFVSMIVYIFVGRQA